MYIFVIVIRVPSQLVLMPLTSLITMKNLLKTGMCSSLPEIIKTCKRLPYDWGVVYTVDLGIYEICSNSSLIHGLYMIYQRKVD